MDEISIRLPVGPVRATVDAGVVEAAGIRYAVAEPTGRPRAYEGQAHGESDPPLQVDNPPVSPQTSSIMLNAVLGGMPDGVEQNPQCQYLSVTAPAGAASGLPVMVWLHGGGYANSGPNFPIYDLTALVREQNVVVVKPAFRLGYLGFGGTSANHEPNLGALDVLVALDWVQENISAFGGDPGQVTVFGQSSGADLALSLLAVESADEKLSQVIAQSPPLGINPLTVRAGQAILEKVGLAETTNYVAAQANIERAAWIRGAGFMPFGIRWGSFPYPSGDRVKLMAEGAAGRRVIIGVNSEESGNYLLSIPLIKDIYRHRGIAAILKVLLVKPSTWTIFSRVAKKLHRELMSRGPAEFYKFSLKGRPAIHMSELPYIFGDITNDAWQGNPLLPRSSSVSDKEIHAVGVLMRASWGRLARGGSPRGFRTASATLRFSRS